MNNYEDIINLSHYEPKKHIRLSMKQRAAQFSPFAALTGYEEVIKETSRITTKKHELTDEEKEILSYKINNNIKKSITITYFVKDKRKKGGMYKTITDKIKKIDKVYKTITLSNNLKISMEDILDINVLQK